ncbi:Fc.00g011260.m01.CDS01 [Cosmosporella sp. VM-42]
MEWTKQTYNQQYERWMPWVEDMYLRWFTKDNKASYTAKDTLDKSKVTGIEQVDTLQDGVNNLAAGQVGQGGLLQPVGDHASKEGFTRAERGGKDDNGGYAPSNVPGAGAVNNAAGSVAEGGHAVLGKTTEGVKNVGGLFGGDKK